MDMAAKYNGNRGTESASGIRFAGENPICEHANSIGQRSCRRRPSHTNTHFIAPFSSEKPSTESPPMPGPPRLLNFRA